MSSTSTLYQGLQSSLEPHILMNKLAPPKSTHSDNTEEEVYVHPLLKLCPLNTKSLEMCTESLGSETGSDIGDNIEEFSRETTFHGFQRAKCVAKKFNRATSFPPPLTSMSGVQVRPHREGGRLVLKAVTITCSNSYFQAERSEGRLRLSLLRDNVYCSSTSTNDDSDDEIHENTTTYPVNPANGENEHGNTDNENEDEIGSRKLGEYPRPSRCKTRISSWEPFWVAIS